MSAIALLGLGVNNQVNQGYGFPGNDFDIFDTDILDSLRPIDSNATNEDFGVTSQEYVDALFEELIEGEDYL